MNGKNIFFFILLQPITKMKRIRIPIHVYNQMPLALNHFSREHLIPKRYFRHRLDSDHWKNIAPCDRYVNSVRKDYCVDDPRKYVSIFLEWQEEENNYSRPHALLPTSLKGFRMVTDGEGKASGLVNKDTRIFVPSPQADMGLVSRSMIFMFQRHSYVYKESFYKIIKNREILEYFAEMPESDLEKQRQKIISDLPEKVLNNSGLDKFRN